MAPSKYITLVSADDFEYVLPREACYASPMLKRTINPDGGFLESRTGVVRMEDMRLVTHSPFVSLFTFSFFFLLFFSAHPHLLSPSFTSVDDENFYFSVSYLKTEPSTFRFWVNDTLHLI